MLHLISRGHLNTENVKSLLMALFGIFILAVAIQRGMDQLSTSPVHSSEANQAASGAGSGFLPMMAAAQSAALPAEKARISGLPTERFIDLSAASNQELETVTLPDGRAIPLDQVPMRLVIPEISLNASIVTASLGTTSFDGGRAYQWLAPNFRAAGWHYSSAPLGEAGNTVVNGHHNAYGEVFRHLEELEVGDHIFMQAQQQEYRYVVTDILYLRERYVEPEIRRENARWIGSTTDERLTLVTCWPYESNSNRLLVIAHPLTEARPSGLLEAP